MKRRGGRKGKDERYIPNFPAILLTCAPHTAATQNAGGGVSGLKDRQGGRAGHAKYVCYICKQQAPDLKSMSQHFESKHPKDTMDQAKFVDTHALFGATTVGVAVPGTQKKEKQKIKVKKAAGEPESDEE